MNPLYHAINRKGGSISFLKGDAKASEEICGARKEAACCTISNCQNNYFPLRKLPGANSLQYIYVYLIIIKSWSWGTRFNMFVMK